MYEIHRVSFFGVAGQILSCATGLSLLLLVVTGLVLYVGRRPRTAHPGRSGTAVA